MFDYELKGYERSGLVKLDILVNKEEVDALKLYRPCRQCLRQGTKDVREAEGRDPADICLRFRSRRQSAARLPTVETVKAVRKDVLAKCYGGDISRKNKLLEKQKEGKKRMRQVGNVEIPQEAFMSVLKLDED